MNFSKSARIALGLLVALQIAALSGCGGDQVTLTTVSGQVTKGGKPQKGLWVRFTPQPGRPSSGRTDANGHYELSYMHDKPGALSGKHTVSIVSGGDVVEGGGVSPETELQSEQVEVKSGDNTLNFELK
jgi:hypothetical protein